MKSINLMAILALLSLSTSLSVSAEESCTDVYRQLLRNYSVTMDEGRLLEQTVDFSKDFKIVHSLDRNAGSYDLVRDVVIQATTFSGFSVRLEVVSTGDFWCSGERLKSVVVKQKKQ